jgi:putative transposase
MTFWRAYYHIIWTTKNRDPLIRPEMEERLFAYMVRKAAELDVWTYAINGWFDHVHLVVAIPPKIAIAEVVKHLKGASSFDINQNHDLDRQFLWQRGYGVLSLGESQRAVAEAYVRDQKEHHQQQTTNAWLEYVAEPNEGPKDRGMTLDDVPAVMRETQSAYHIDDDFPF